MRRFIFWTLAVFTFIALLGFSSKASADVDTWTKKADMPTARWGLSTSVVNGKIYAIGGSVGQYRPLSTVEEYDPVTDTWAKRADMPTARGWLATSAVNGYIYAIGGYPGRVVEAYDTGVGIRVTRISPQEGRVTGGEPIAIFGSGFPSDAIVTIGGKPLTELKVTDTLITGITPPGTEGEQDIWITAPGLDFSVLAGKFIYTPLSTVVVTAMTPNNGKQAGGDRGSITGSGFLNPDAQEAVKLKGFISVGEVAYNYPNPFRAERDYKEAGPQLLLQAFLQRIVNQGGRVEREYGLGRMRTDLLVIWPSPLGVQKFVLELKLLYGSLEQTLAEGIKQTLEYMDICGTEEGHLVHVGANL